MRVFLLSGVTAVQAGVYCPSAGDLVTAYGDNVQIRDQGWTVTGDGGAATKTAFNLNGGYVEYDMDVSSAQSGVIPNIYSVSPSGIGGGFDNDKYCDGADNDKPWCMEIDWIEANGACGGATTLHTVPGPGDNGCTSWGCRTSYHFGGSKFHMKVEYDSSGHYTITRDGQSLGGFSPAPGDGDFETIRSTHESAGAVIYSSQWTSSWVPPPDDCGSGPGNLDGSTFSISNLRISGSVVQGPEPASCTGPSPPTPGPPSPGPAPGGTCETQVGKNNDGTNLKSTADITSSADSCCSKCSETSGCVGYTWVHDNGECWMKSQVGAPRDDECGGCVTSGTYTPPAPTPVPPPPPTPVTPTPTPSPLPGCPGGSLPACIKSCPTDPTAFQTCVNECTVRCSGSQSCTGGDDGSSLVECMGNCPSDSYQDCASCCAGKFPSNLV